MIKTTYIVRNTFFRCYAATIDEAIYIFRENGISGELKEIGTDKWIEF